ncbi:hypothetical protein ACERII_13165 [Evansella sp. AB-rgal1]|uniref:hypothetical protein n=1 Tax=Evansella sp. AB-rgal1 TaxID=3242696 RepID=UPI00359E2CB7
MKSNGMYVLALLVITFIVFAIGATLFVSTNPYTDFILTLIAVHLVASKLVIKEKENVSYFYRTSIQKRTL